MSLQVWLPLNGNINNQGICDSLEVSAGTPQYIDGKMGQGIDISHRVTFTGLPRLNNFSIFFWLKVDSCTVSWADSLGFDCKQADGTNAASFRFEATTETRACSWHNNSPYGISSGSQILIQNYEEWHHVGLTYDGDNVYSYIDGKLKYTNSGLGGYLIDRFWIGETGNIVGVMNDLRIYDNVLSKSEVKELSNGCLLHYSFNNGYGNENLIIEANKASSWVSDGCAKSNIQDKEFGECIKVVGASANCRIYRPVQNVWTPVGAKFTVSFWAKSDEDGTIINASRSIVDFTSNFTLTTKWQRYVGHITATATEGTLSIRIVTAGRTVYIKDIKLERGEHNSPWSPNPSDELYSQLGFDDTTIRNNAGYKMDGIMSKQLTYSSDSIIGTSSLDLRGEDYISYIRVPDYPKLEKDFTWNVWVKQNNSTLPKTTQAVISQGRDWVNNNAENGTDCGFNIFIVNGKPEIRYGHWVASGSSNRQLLSNVTLDNEWHMITASIDKNGIGRIYVDGILKNTSTVATICKYTQATGNLIIGKTSYSYASTNQFFPFNGLIDDVQLFATTLSDNDIKQLYESKVRVDKDGNLFAGEFIESQKTEGNLLSSGWDFPTGHTNHGGAVFKSEQVNCNDSPTGKATKYTCTTVGNGFYINGLDVFSTGKSKCIDGKQYIWSMYIKSDNKTKIQFNVECGTSIEHTQFQIGTEYKRIGSVFTYSKSAQYSAFTSYQVTGDQLLTWNVNDNIYIHSFCVEEYNPEHHFNKKSIVETNNFLEIREEKETKVYKQDIQTNQIIEI